MKASTISMLPPLLLLALTTGVALQNAGSSSVIPINRSSAPILTFKDLDTAILPMWEGGPVNYPAWLEELDGKPVEVTGFMAPFDQLDDLSTFMLMPSYVGCYFCAPPSFTQVLLVQQAGQGRGSRPFIDPPIRVNGVLRLYHPASNHPAHRDQFVYALDDAICTIVSGDEAPRRAKAHASGPPRLGRAADTPDPVTDPLQPHQAFQPQLLVPAVSKLRSLPLRREMRFTKASPGELEVAMRKKILGGLTEDGGRSLNRVLDLLGWLPVGASWEEIALEHQRPVNVGSVRADGGEVLYHEELPLSKPAGRLAIASLIYEALLRQNYPDYFEPAPDVETWLTRQALVAGDLALLRTDYIRRNWLSAPDPLATLSWNSPIVDLPAPLQRWLELPGQAGHAFLSKQRNWEVPGFLESLYTQPPDSFNYWWRPDWLALRSPSSQWPVPTEPQSIQDETRLGSATLLAWLGEETDPMEHRTLLARLIQDRAFWRANSADDLEDIFVWQTEWSDELDARVFAKWCEAAKSSLPGSWDLRHTSQDPQIVELRFVTNPLATARDGTQP
jgi:hypothetical protein